MIFWIWYPQSNFKSNSLSINKKNHIYIKCSLLNKTLHSVKSEIFSIKLWKKTYQILCNEYNFFRPWKWNTIFRNDLPCPRILKMIRQNKWFNRPVNGRPNKLNSFLFWKKVLLFFPPIKITIVFFFRHTYQLSSTSCRSKPV